VNGEAETKPRTESARGNVRVLLSAELERALGEGHPVVALESTILCHGLPFPENLETHRAAEETVRREGAVPALVSVVDGVPRAGLSPAEVEFLARAGRSVRKATTRDLGLLAARRESGATTVAATMAIASAAGIRVFATGGIGGVHRGAAEIFDVSADLLELSRTRVAVVASGAKAVLDLPKTLEALETLGVPVLGFGTSEFPAFWIRDVMTHGRSPGSSSRTGRGPLPAASSSRTRFRGRRRSRRRTSRRRSSGALRRPGRRGSPGRR
jgi:pseudouridine-5'-phosphate glycosidase